MKNLKNLKYLLGLVLIAVIFSSCLDDDSIEKEREAAIYNLKNYLAEKNIPYAGTDTIYCIYIDTTKRDSNSVAIKSSYYIKIKYNLRLISNNNLLVETSNHALAKAKRLRPASIFDEPVLTAVENTSIYGIYRAVLRLQKNDSAEFVIPFDWAFGSYQTSNIPSFSSLLFQVKIVDVIPDIVEYDKSFWSRWVVDSLQLSLSDTTEDVPVYIKKMNYGDTTQPVELYDVVTVIYKGWLTDGKVFTDNYDTITYTVGNNTLIKGFDIAVQQLNLAQRAKVFLPYYHAYGKNARFNVYSQQVIPPYSSLIYEIFLYKKQ